VFFSISSVISRRSWISHIIGGAIGDLVLQGTTKTIQERILKKTFNMLLPNVAAIFI